MVYKEHGMWEVLEVLRRAHRGEGLKSISRSTSRSRNAVRRYLRTARGLGWTPGAVEPDERLAALVLSKLRPGSRDASPGQSEALLLPHRASVQRWLENSPDERGSLRLTKIHDLLDRQGVKVSYIALYRFAVKYCEFGRGQTTVRVADVSAGELAEIDFGRLGIVPDSDGGRRVLWALVVTLVFSRHQYVHLTHSQKIPDLIDGLENAWAFFGGVTRRAVLDNLRAAICRVDRYDPTFNRTFEEYARHRDFVIDPAPPRRPTGKPHVERQVPYVRENFFRGEQFLSRDHAQVEALRWCREKAGMRIHGTTRKRPLEQFEAFERPALKPLGADRFDPPRWAELKAHPDHHVRFGYALYSVPTAYVGKKISLRADRSLVRLYFGGELIKTHPVQPPGGRHTDYTDYPKEKTAYAMRSPDYMIRQAREHGEDIGQFMAKLLAGDFPWARLRQAQKLLRLIEKYGAQHLAAACRRALSFDLINVARLETILVRALATAGSEQRPPVQGQLIQQPLRFLRETGSFTHTTPKEDHDGD